MRSEASASTTMVPTTTQRQRALSRSFVCVMLSLSTGLVVACADRGPDLRNLVPATAASYELEAPAIIDNGPVMLGVNPEGDLNGPGGSLSSGTSGSTTVGLRFMATNGDALSPGCLCEGWGVADAAAGAHAWARRASGGSFNMTVESFTKTA